MSKGPWTRLTKDSHEATRELHGIQARKKLDLEKQGFMPRAEAAALLHKKAVEIADGPPDEWVQINLKVEKRKVE